ncbi:hypothetical protein [Halomonas beimenensis]|uniref:DUF4148 domain-containing protein n=1 Tax=Halomonas beimenensis TaxID=475662 RepID=A0A291P6C1_9GAMM|nr:hypothetical protein [Halomonas beimenensis]ATJ82434.1 hypothetical protein BEI_1447 [Halomonas beimenensis]
MNTKLTLSALLLAALPLVAHDDNATERALQLNQEPLSTLSQGGATATSGPGAAEIGGDSETMRQAREALQARGGETRFADSGDDLRLGREATS